MNLHLFDWIWHIKGTVALAPGQSRNDTFDRLAPLFDKPGTTHERTGDTLSFRKKDQAAQDKMSVFDSGVLRIERGVSGMVLHYRLASHALLFCFLAPLLFLFFAQATVFLGNLEKPGDAASEKAQAAKKPKVLPQNPIDKALGAPAPEMPKKDGKDAGKHKKQSPTSAYVFAAIFAVLYVVGRILEDRLVRSLFTKGLVTSPSPLMGSV